MKINLSIPAKTLAGEPWKENGKIVMLNHVIANKIATMNGGSRAIEMYEFATKLHNAAGEIEIDESKKSLIKDAASELIAVLAGQVLIILNNVK